MGIDAKCSELPVFFGSSVSGIIDGTTSNSPDASNGCNGCNTLTFPCPISTWNDLFGEICLKSLK